MGLVASTVGTGEAAHLASVGSATRVAVVVLIVVAICGGLWLLAKFAAHQGICSDRLRARPMAPVLWRRLPHQPS